MAVITVEKRNADKNPRQLRAEGKLTGTIYGKGQESVSVELNEKAFMTEYAKDKNATFSVSLEGKTMDAKIKDVQVNYRTGENLNVQFVLV